MATATASHNRARLIGARGMMTIALAAAVTAPAMAIAQERGVDARSLASAISQEQRELDQLRAELERRSEALVELAHRLASLERQSADSPSTTETVGQLAVAAIAPVPIPASPQAEAQAPPRFDFYADSRVRYETLQQHYDGCVGCPNRQRGRLRLRLGAEGKIAPDFRAVVGLGLGELNDPNTVYANLGNDFGRKVATWDRAFIEYHPQKARWLNITAGKFPYTWLRSSMTFDVDFYPEGISERIEVHNSERGLLRQVSAQGFQLIFAEQPLDRHMTIVGNQLTARLQPASRLSTTVAATAVVIHRPELLLQALLDGSDVGVRNTNAITARDGRVSYASEFSYGNVIVENAIRTPWEALPITLGLEFQRNFRAASRRDSAFSFRIDGGRAQRRGDWDFGWHMFRVEQDAILAGLGESDWRAPSNVLQHRLALNRMLQQNVQLSFTLYRGRTLNGTLPGAVLAPGLSGDRRDPWTNRAYFDITYRY